MQLSVIILNYNVRYFLEQCVLSVQKALEGIDGEIIVVDNNSPDDSCAMMAQRFPDVQLIAQKENAGFPIGNNVGVARAKGKYVCILNPDTVVGEETFHKLFAFVSTQQNLGITGVKMIDGTGNFLPESKRGTPTPWVAMSKIAGLYKVFPKLSLFNKYYAQHLDENTTGQTDILTGAFMFMERELYRSVGGFDEDYFMYGEDVDISYTVLKAGKKNMYYPGTSILHYKGESTVRDKTYMKRFNDAMQEFYRKHFKKSAAFDLFMKTSVSFFVIAKKNKKTVVIQPEEYLLFSKEESLKEHLEKTTGKKVIRLAEYKQTMLFSAKNSHKKRIEVIFDNEMLSFGEIITIMECHKNQGYTFKIKPAGCNFILGSNNSNGRGSVLTW
ncbi:glycosyltransferase family 2 protein [Flavobacterium salilacus subsp. salilacus]|uniref:glycosyltransferase family 2 protein n=1 Tax=Flavobacterium TaxID=237 RepID=UPI00107587A8|nr:MULTISPECIES: glycosyltransferase family 2 protein [Flavobacterium]KAF2519431.1 glycosyltransferase family 2 protein [Flavobacterium salilacus subsp. salilacus]MBE1614677.1 glycosyltransferase family 2 protein [Flavobacterium sp. SaA2.13]